MLRHKVNGLLTSPAKGVNARVHHQTASSEDLEGIMSVPAEGEILKVSLFVAHLLVIFDRPVARSLSLALPIIFSHLSLLLLHQPTTYLLNTRLQPSFTTTNQHHALLQSQLLQARTCRRDPRRGPSRSQDSRNRAPIPRGSRCSWGTWRGPGSSSCLP